MNQNTHCHAVRGVTERKSKVTSTARILSLTLTIVLILYFLPIASIKALAEGNGNDFDSGLGTGLGTNSGTETSLGTNSGAETSPGINSGAETSLGTNLALDPCIGTNLALDPGLGIDLDSGIEAGLSLGIGIAPTSFGELQHTITFITGSGTNTPDVTIIINDGATLNDEGIYPPVLAPKAGTSWVFRGWSPDFDSFDRDEPIHDDLEFIAQWEPTSNTNLTNLTSLIFYYGDFRVTITSTGTGSNIRLNYLVEKEYVEVYRETNVNPGGNGHFYYVHEIHLGDLDVGLTIHIRGNKITEDTVLEFSAGYTVAYLPGTCGSFREANHLGIPSVYNGVANSYPTPPPPADYDVPGTDGWRFAGWSPDWQPHVTGDVFYVAQWEAIDYEVVVVDSFVSPSGSGIYNVGNEVFINAGSRPGWVFTGWTVDYGDIILSDASDPETGFVMPAKDVKVTASWEEAYTVTFLNWNGDELSKQEVPYGSGATAPANPTREGYTFTGWDKGFDYITTNLTVTALFIEDVVDDPDPDDPDPDDPDPDDPNPDDPDPDDPDPDDPDPDNPDDPDEPDPDDPDPDDPDPDDPDPDDPNPDDPDPDDPDLGDLDPDDPDPDDPYNPNFDLNDPNPNNSDPNDPEIVIAPRSIGPAPPAAITTLDEPVVPTTPTSPVTPITPTTPTTPSLSEIQWRLATAFEHPLTPRYTLVVFWSLVNLAIVVFDMLIVVGLFALYLKNRRDSEYSKKHLMPRLATAFLVVLAIALFLIAEDISQPMSWVNQWTAWHVIILAMVAVFSLGSVLMTNADETEGTWLQHHLPV